MEKKDKLLYEAPVSETLRFCDESFLCKSQVDVSGTTGLQDYEVQPEEEL